MRPGWFKFPDNLISDQRICRIGQAQAITALIAAYSHAEKEESDGFVPRGVPVGVSSEVVVAGLVLSGLFEEVPGGLQIVGFLEINATHERREAERAATLKRVQEFRARREEKEANTVKNTVSNGVNNASGMRDEVLGTRNEDLPPSAAPASPGKPSKPRKTHPNFTAVIALADEIVKAATGEKITWGIPKNRNAADLLAKSATLEEIGVRLRRAFVERKPDWLWRGGPLSFAKFASNFDEFAVVSAPDSGRITWNGPYTEPTNGAHP